MLSTLSVATFAALHDENRPMDIKVLIVEDESAIADAIQYPLETEGFEPCWVTSAKDALAVLADRSIGIVILDVGLPDMNGFELLKLIRHDSDVPVIFLTARDEEIDRVVGLEIGADDYVTKPFSPRELVARVKTILKRTGWPADASSPAGFRLDEDKARILFQGQSLNLTRAEYTLLLTLLKQPGRVFERSQLITQVWNSSHPSDERVIDTHIKEIRAKLRKIDVDADPIKTHRGHGYSIIL